MQESEATKMSDSNNSLENKLMSILSDPGAMSAITSLVKGLNIGSGIAQKDKAEAPVVSEAVPAGSFDKSDHEAPGPIAPALAHHHGGPEFNNRSLALLLALKPFLSCERAQKLDVLTQILKVMALADIFK